MSATAFMYVTVPTLVIGALYKVSGVHSANTWISSLQCADDELYPMGDNHHDLDNMRIVDAPSEAPLPKSRIGLRLRQDAFSRDETGLLYDLLLQAVREKGSSPSEQFQRNISEWAAESGIVLPNAGHRIWTDHHEREGAVVSSEWGSGDALDMNRIEPVMRALIRRIGATHSVPVGRLRHVRCDYFPSGTPFLMPIRNAQYDGYDIFHLPLRPDAFRESPVVLTFTPSQRSRFNQLATVGAQSWSVRDWDVLAKTGDVLHVYGEARFSWRLCTRPTQWFGSPQNPVPFLGVSSASAAESKAPSWWARWWSPAASSRVGSSAQSDSLHQDRGLIIATFAFEGASTSERSKFRHPEKTFFGGKPKDKDLLADEENVFSYSDVTRWQDALRKVILLGMRLGVVDKNAFTPTES